MGITRQHGDHEWLSRQLEYLCTLNISTNMWRVWKLDIHEWELIPETIIAVGETSCLHVAVQEDGPWAMGRCWLRLAQLSGGTVLESSRLERLQCFDAIHFSYCHRAENKSTYQDHLFVLGY